MFLTKMALKNLARNKKRTIITALVISLGIVIFLVSDSLIVGMEEISIDNNINLLTSHLQIMDEKYWDKREELPLDNLLDDNLLVVNQIKNELDIEKSTKRLYFSANINNGREEYPISAIGIEASTDSEVFKLEQYLLEGQNLKNSKNAVIGKKLANLMGFELGDYITLLFKTKEGTFNTIEAELVGTLATSHPEINEYHVYIPLQDAQSALGLEGKVSRYFFRLEGKDESIPVTNKINSILNEKSSKLKAYNWEKLSEDILAMTRQGNIENLIMLIVIIILAAVGVINIVILSVLERLEEIGMMKALGLKAREIVYIFVIESTGIGLLGSAVGVIIGFIGVYLLANIGIDVGSITGGETTFGIPIIDRLYGGWRPNAFIFIFFFGIITSVLASILPARWGAKKDPVKAIYHK